MPSSSFLVRGIDERIRDLSMRSEMQAHSHRAMPTVTSPICNEFKPAKIQIIRSGFGQNHHLVSRPARELPQMGDGRQVQGPNPFLASTYQRILPHNVNATIGRTVVHLPPPAVYLLPRPVLSSLTPEILAPTAVDPIQTLSVAVSHTPDRSPAKISGILKRKRAEHEMLAKIRRSRRVRFGGVPATPRRGAAMRGPLKAYTRGNQIRPDLLLTPRGRPSVGRLISFWDAPMVAMGISPPPEVYDPIKPKTVSGLVSFWNSMSNDMDMDMAPPPTEHGKQHVPVMEWGLSDVKEPTSPMDMPSPSRDNGWESPIARSSDLPRQSVSVEKIDCLWADPEEELGDLSSLPDDELYHLLGDHEEELEHLWGVSDRSVDDSVEITPKIATISADNLFRIRTPESPKVETMDMDMSGFLGKESRYDTKSDSQKLRVQGYEFSPKNSVSSRDTTIGGVKWTETIADMPRQSVSSVEMDCSWADSVEHRSPITVQNPFLISESSTWQKSRPQSNNGRCTDSCVANAICSAFSSPCPLPVPVPYSLPLPRPFAYTRGPARTSHGANGFRKKRIGRL
ncbi:hypothetical protein BASA50_008632 [Batrachochytrium salamandrivorans]|uniref:Uncharacterized protein n=1 Tax=Batrachochytrium salamandrivorans TaxID=1357716 RepID=A0ABQ8F3R6_9FUNG|nr:hypothetical protein BASA50_008632 [Batrachochytrium salamandrivorans]